MRYVRSGEWLEAYSATVPMKNENMKDYCHMILNEYDVPETSKRIVESSFQKGSSASLAEQQAANNAAVAPGLAVKDKKTVLLASIFPIFLESKVYASYIEKKNKKPSLPTIPSETPVEADETDNHSSVSVSVVLENDEQKAARAGLLYEGRTMDYGELVARAANSMNESDLESLLETGDWISDLFVAVEDVPICVSLATASPDKPGFPLIYVNKRFESVTGYSRSECIGRNCKFLQTEESEESNVNAIRMALKNAQPIKSSVTNKKKDGTLFLNLLTLKPVFNARGIYSYVLCVQLDISNEMNVKDYLNTMDDFLALLPNIFH